MVTMKANRRFIKCVPLAALARFKSLHAVTDKDLDYVTDSAV